MDIKGENGESLTQMINEATSALRKAIEGKAPEIGIILGSGLGSLADKIDNAKVIDFAQIPHMKTSTAISHAGRFVVGTMSGKEVICMQGRLHGYEGYASQEIVLPVWVMGKLGVKSLIVTNAVGAINRNFSVGDFCVIADHINFTGRNPLAGIEPDHMASRFQGMLDAYDPCLRRLAKDVALELKMPMQQGVYLGLTGPSLETPAEIRAFGMWGADTVAMSVVEEVIAARHAGMNVLGISLITNMACGVEGGNPGGMEVLEVAKSREGDFCRLIETIVERM